MLSNLTSLGGPLTDDSRWECYDRRGMPEVTFNYFYPARLPPYRFWTTRCTFFIQSCMPSILLDKFTTKFLRTIPEIPVEVHAASVLSVHPHGEWGIITLGLLVMCEYLFVFCQWSFNDRFIHVQCFYGLKWCLNFIWKNQIRARRGWSWERRIPLGPWLVWQWRRRLNLFAWVDNTDIQSFAPPKTKPQELSVDRTRSENMSKHRRTACELNGPQTVELFVRWTHENKEPMSPTQPGSY
jgi:hypothetical protein